MSNPQDSHDPLDATASRQARTGGAHLGAVSEGSLADWESKLEAPTLQMVPGDARDLPLQAKTVDVVITSPPYWQKRDYGHVDQIGLESTPKAYVSAIMECLTEWRRVLRPTGSVFLNVGDTYYKNSLVGIPGRIEADAVDAGWVVRNRIIWTKDGGMPEPARNRLANRHEYILHLAPRRSYYYDLLGYSEAMGGNGANPGDVWRVTPDVGELVEEPGDVWHINPERNMGAHLAPYPRDLVRRAVLLGCPPQVCSTCGTPRTRVMTRTRELDSARPQARRAMELADAAGLSDAHIAAIQATGVSDAGKALKVQNGTGRNSTAVQVLAAEAKEVLGGYFREFTFAKRVTTGWTDCGHHTPGRGVVLDPFAGTGTSLTVANGLGRDAVGVDLTPLMPQLASVPTR